MEFLLSIFVGNVIFMGRKRREWNNLKTNKRVSEVSLRIDVDAELDKALSFHQAGNLQQAEERYRKILKANPQHTDVLHLLGLVNYQSGKAEIAISFIKKAISLSPESPNFLRNLGDIFRSLKRFDEAIQAYQKAIRTDPKHTQAYNNMGHLSPGSDNSIKLQISVKRQLNLIVITMKLTIILVISTMNLDSQRMHSKLSKGL